MIDHLWIVVTTSVVLSRRLLDRGGTAWRGHVVLDGRRIPVDQLIQEAHVCTPLQLSDRPAIIASEVRSDTSKVVFIH